MVIVTVDTSYFSLRKQRFKNIWYLSYSVRSYTAFITENYK